MSADTKRFQTLFMERGPLVEEAKALRRKIFFKDTGKDEDQFDEFCTHVIVIDKDTNGVVGTYRLLLGSIAKEKCGFYSETEFDLENIKQNCKGQVLEMGRACVRESYRQYPILNFMWKQIYSYIIKNKIQYLIGCASIENPSPHKIGRIIKFFQNNYFSPVAFRVFPLEGKRYRCLKAQGDFDPKKIGEELPSLVKSYLKAGAWVCGDPAWDKIFGVVDFFMMLDMNRMDSTFTKKLL
ncbi:MAG: GNAT family N-acetyltransferase [Candidatus Omnitrophota bacterium]|nr:MAG: GNAT family N-acetyltransferase [Candidatus Omnitrophota bacterium]